MKVRYYGHVGQRTGYGRAAEATCLAFLSAGVDLEIRPLMQLEHLDFTRPGVLPLANCLRTDAQMTPRPDIIFIHTLPFDCERVLQIVMGSEANSIKACAYTTWEGDSLIPDSFVRSLASFDRVYFPCAQNVARWPTPRPTPIGDRIDVLNHAYDPSVAHLMQYPRTESDRYRFYYLGAWTGRKNPAGVIRAYLSEFRHDEPVELVMQCAGASQADFVVAAHSTGLDRSQMAPILFHGEVATDDEIDALHRDADCFVTATRGEAWNFPAFDAMIAGRHIIAPRYMGHDEFLTSTTASMYGGFIQPAQGDVKIAPAPEGYPAGTVNLQFMGPHGLTGKALWIEPDLLWLGRLMRHAFKNRIRGITVRYNPADNFSYERVGRELLASLETL